LIQSKPGASRAPQGLTQNEVIDDFGELEATQHQESEALACSELELPVLQNNRETKTVADAVENVLKECHPTLLYRW
jgi:arginase family enzyme